MKNIVPLLTHVRPVMTPTVDLRFVDLNCGDQYCLHVRVVRFFRALEWPLPRNPYQFRERCICLASPNLAAPNEHFPNSVLREVSTS